MKRIRLRQAQRSFFLIAGLIALLSACTMPFKPAGNDVLNGISRVPDSTLVQEGLPTYIIMIEGMLSRTPDDPELLQGAAQLYSFYGSQIEDTARARLLTGRSLDYAILAAASSIPGLRSARQTSFRSFTKVLATTTPADKDTLFFMGSIWLEWMRVRKDDLDAIADLPMVQLMMERVVQLEPGYKHGMALLYLAILSALGQEDQQTVRELFLRALSAAEDKNILPEAVYATWQKSHGRIQESCQRLGKILQAGIPEAPSFTFYNQQGLKLADQTYEELDRSGKCNHKGRQDGTY